MLGQAAAVGQAATNAVVTAIIYLIVADAGQLAEARLACERMLKNAPASAALYALLGAIDFAQGRADAAAEAFRRSLYLDPDCVEALEQMIVISDRKGNAAQAAALRRRLARLSREDAP